MSNTEYKAFLADFASQIDAEDFAQLDAEDAMELDFLLMEASL